jgi:hypothetical protein
MEYYIFGVSIAFLINIYTLLLNMLTGISRRIKNLKKIGGHYNLTKGQLTKEKPTVGKLAFWVADILIITPLLSWLYVGYYVVMLIKARINKTPVPEKLKEINFKLSSIDLPKELVKECLNEIARFYGGPGVDFRSPYDDDDWKNYYDIKSGDGRHDWNVHLDLDKSTHSFVITSRDPDFGEHIDTFDYRFEGTVLWSRTIETKHEYPDHVDYEIRDGVVLEQEYRERQKSSLFTSEEEIEERVKKLYGEVEWSEHNHPTVRYFVLFRHDDVLDDTAAKKYFRSELERITDGYRRLESRVNTLGCRIGQADFQMGNTIFCADNENTPEANLEEIRDILYGEGLSRFGLTFGEFLLYEKIIEDLKRYLSKL